MLTFDSVWHFGEGFSSWMNPSFHCWGQMADSVYSVVWMSGLLMSTLWIEWNMVAVGLWYGQAYVMDNEQRWILLMAFWMHREFLPISSNFTQHWRGVDQHSTGHNQQPDQLYVKEMCCTAWGKWCSPQKLTGFQTPPDPPNILKLYILEWCFIVASLRHTCAIIMLSNQHLDMPHLWGGWIISAKEKCSLTHI